MLKAKSVFNYSHIASQSFCEAIGSVRRKAMSGKEGKQPELKLCALAWPIFISNILGIMLGLIDVYVISKVSDLATSAISTACQVTGICSLIFSVVCGATSILVAQYLGKGDREKATQTGMLCILINVFFGERNIVTVVAGISAVVFVADEMLPQKQIIAGILAEQCEQIFKDGRVIFCFVPQFDVDLSLIFFSQRKNRMYIFFRFTDIHAESGTVCAREYLGAMVGKTQYLQTAGNSGFYILPFLADCMVTKGRVCMIIFEKFSHFSILPEDAPRGLRLIGVCLYCNINFTQ